MHLLTRHEIVIQDDSGVLGTDFGREVAADDVRVTKQIHLAALEQGALGCGDEDGAEERGIDVRLDLGLVQQACGYRDDDL